MSEPEVARLDELDRDEFYDLTRLLRPSLTQEEFDAMWDEFHRLKQRRRAH